MVVAEGLVVVVEEEEEEEVDGVKPMRWWVMVFDDVDVVFCLLPFLFLVLV